MCSHRMHEMQTIVTDVCGVCLSVSLSCGLTRLHRAKTTERIKVLMETLLGAHGALCYTGVLISHIEGEGTHFWISGPSRISRMVKARALKFRIHIDGCGSQPKSRKAGHTGIRAGSRDLLLTLTACKSQEHLQLESPERAMIAVHSMQPSPSYFGLLFKMSTGQC